MAHSEHLRSFLPRAFLTSAVVEFSLVFSLRLNSASGSSMSAGARKGTKNARWTIVVCSFFLFSLTVIFCCYWCRRRPCCRATLPLPYQTTWTISYFFFYFLAFLCCCCWFDVLGCYVQELFSVDHDFSEKMLFSLFLSFYFKVDNNRPGNLL